MPSQSDLDRAYIALAVDLLTPQERALLRSVLEQLTAERARQLDTTWRPAESTDRDTSAATRYTDKDTAQ